MPPSVIPPDPRKNPRYKDLFGEDANTSPLADLVNKSFAAYEKQRQQEILNDINAAKYDEYERGLEERSQLGELLKGKTGDDLWSTAGGYFSSVGDLENSLKVEDQLLQRKRGEQQQKIQIFQQIQDPEMKAEFWNTQMSDQYGLGRVSPEAFKREERWKVGRDGTTYRMNEMGELELGERVPGYDRVGRESAPVALTELYDQKTGAITGYVNPRDPVALNAELAKGRATSRPKASDSGEASFDDEEEEAPVYVVRPKRK